MALLTFCYPPSCALLAVGNWQVIESQSISVIVWHHIQKSSGT